MAELLIAKAHYPVTVLGPGIRAGIWTQGCTIGCAGCLARDTWAADPATAVDVGVILGWLASLPGPVQGVTISGGEPFQQPEALGELLRGIDAWRAGQDEQTGRDGQASRDIDILVYTGYALSRLKRAARSARLLSLCDAVVAGPYVQARNTGQRWRGSANQQIVPMTSLGRQRYTPARLADPGPGSGSPQMQVSAEDGRVYFIGIPRRGVHVAAAARLTQAGLRPGEVSWRP
jgi:anaerobic ribonucleoside-triphosphate reductase activating protein